MEEMHLKGLLFALRVVSFFIATYFSFQCFFKMYVGFIQQLGEIQLNKSYKVSVHGSFTVGLPLYWSIFYLLCNLGG